MKVLIVSQYFWPEYFRVNDLAVSLKEKNFDVDVLTGYANYPNGQIYTDFKLKKKNYSKYKKIDIYRVPLIPRGSGSKIFLSLNYISFLFFAFFCSPFILRKKKYDLVLTYGTSPILVGLIGIFLAKIKKAKHFLWVLDLWPDVLIDLNIFNNKSVIYAFLKRLVKYIYTKTDCILCQSIAFKKEIGKLVPEIKSRLVYFPSWPEEIHNFHINKKKSNLFDKSNINIVFAGNIGESQNFAYLVNNIFLSTKGNIIWHIFGEGRNNLKLQNLIKSKNISNIIMHGHKNFPDLVPFLNEADYLLISLRYEKTFASTIPGKFQTYLEFGKPILAFLGGEVASMIKKYKLGLVYEKNTALNYRDLKFFLDQKISITDQTSILKKVFSRKRGINKLEFYYKNYQKIFGHKIKIIINTNKLNYNENFILTALNLAFLGSYSSGDVNFHSKQIFWLDGYYKKDILKAKEDLPKVAGRELLKKLTIDRSIIKNIYIVGSATEKVINYSKNLFNDFKIVYIDLPFSDTINDFKKFIPEFQASDLIVLILPTPKQEQIAYWIASKSKHYKILCIGGALNMLSGEEKVVPKIMEKIFFAEAVWRLQYSTKRRLIRLAKSYYHYNKGSAKGIYRDIEYEVIK